MKRTKSPKGEHVLVIAESGVDLSDRLSALDARSCVIDKLVQAGNEDSTSFAERVAKELSAYTEVVHHRTLFIAREPIGPRLNVLVRAIVSSMPRGAHLVLCAEHPSELATLALSAVALTVLEMTPDANVTVEGQTARIEPPQRSWRRRIDQVLDGLLAPSSALRRSA